MFTKFRFFDKMNYKIITSLFTSSSIIILFGFIISATCVMNKPRKLYTGYKLLRVDNVTSEYEEVLIQTLEHRDTVQLWRLPKVNDSAEILVGQSRLDDVMEFLREIDVQAEIIHPDISILLNEERESYMAPSGAPLGWETYHDYDDIISYFMYKLGTNMSSNVRLSSEVIGKSEMGRDIYLFKASRDMPKFDDREMEKPAIWIDAGLQGRDWLAISTATYFLDRLVSGDYDHILLQYDFFFVPLINPDGYHFTRTTDRFWGKNLGVRVNGKCEGVNLDRNFALMYRGELMELYSKGTGVAHNPCSDYYGGTVSHIEPEVTALSRAIWTRRQQISLYFSLQSYSQTWLIPKEPVMRNGDFDMLTSLAEIGNAALEQVAGAKYQVSSWEYSQAEPPGKCIDWMKQIAGIKYSYAIKVRDDGTSRGYLVPANQIKSVGEEVMAGVIAMALRKSE